LEETQCVTKFIESSLRLPSRPHCTLVKHVKDVTRIARQSRSVLTDWRQECLQNIIQAAFDRRIAETAAAIVCLRASTSA
jgi:hypothetical protein